MIFFSICYQPLRLHHKCWYLHDALSRVYSMLGPTWASKNLGLFICMDCAGIHRSLGVHISEVRSCALDSWTSSWVSVMEAVGNSKGNQIWEARMASHIKIGPQSNSLARNKFIRDKYERRLYYSPPADGASLASAPVLTAAEKRRQARLAARNGTASTASIQQSVPQEYAAARAALSAPSRPLVTKSSQLANTGDISSIFQVSANVLSRDSLLIFVCF